MLAYLFYTKNITKNKIEWTNGPRPFSLTFNRKHKSNNQNQQTNKKRIYLKKHVGQLVSNFMQKKETSAKGIMEMCPYSKTLNLKLGPSHKRNKQPILSNIQESHFSAKNGKTRIFLKKVILYTLMGSNFMQNIKKI